MDKATLIALAERVESATGPDRELDGLIYMAQREARGDRLPVSWKVLPDTGQIYAWNNPPPHASGTGGVWASAPRYTASLDAAAALVPEGLYWTAGYGRMRPDEPLGGAIITRPYRDRPPVAEAEAPTPALALLAAALRARAAMMED